MTEPTALPDQASGISDDGGGLPEAARAAERVATVVEWWGDAPIPIGTLAALNDHTIPQTLYTRDLMALTRMPAELDRVSTQLAEATRKYDELSGQRDAWWDFVSKQRHAVEDERDAVRAQLDSLAAEIKKRCSGRIAIAVSDIYRIFVRHSVDTSDPVAETSALADEPDERKAARHRSDSVHPESAGDPTALRLVRPLSPRPAEPNHSQKP